MTDPIEKSPDSGTLSIEELQSRYLALNTRKIQAETNLENAVKHLDALRKEAREKYETDDVKALRKKLDEMTSDNEQKRKSYQAEIERIEKDLLAVEQRVTAPENPPLAEEETP